MAAGRSNASARASRPVAPDREIELKLRLRPQDLAALRERLDALAPARQLEVDNTYFDTPDLRLAAARAALRLRRVAHGRRHQWLQTLKTDDRDAALAVRGEWETPAPGGRLDARRLEDSPLHRLLHGAAGPLAPVFRTVFSRRTWELLAHGAHLEVALDEGRIEAGGQSAPILELEIELRSGTAGALFDAALELGAGLSLLPFGASKAARGLRLAQQRPLAEPVPGLLKARAGHGRPAPFAPELAAAQAARHWLAHGADALLANAAGALDGDDPEFVHQARIALRFMRVGLRLFAPALVRDGAPPAALARELQGWARCFGDVREWDVLCGQILPALRAQAGKGSAAWERVQAQAARRQRKALLRLRKRLQSPDFAQFALRLLRWSGAGAAGADAAGGRLDDFAAEALQRDRRELAKAARGFAKASMARQHKIRLQAKSQRYAIEALRGVAPQAEHKGEQRVLARFQDAAGCARDLALARRALRGLTHSRPLLRQIDDWTRAQKRAGLEKACRLADVLKKA
jgi:inorganic triphosphatase YgiF